MVAAGLGPTATTASMSCCYLAGYGYALAQKYGTDTS